MPTAIPLDELSLTQRLARDARVRLHGLARRAAWALDPAAYPRPEQAEPSDAFPHPLVHVVRRIARDDAGAEPRIEAGKRHNLRQAAPAFDGAVLTPERGFSFWRSLGPATIERGFVSGMELRSGCVVPAIGGGLCLVSGALFEAAARADFEILERWGHTREAAPPDPALPFGVDATVFYPHVDLRFRPRGGRALLRVAVVDREHGPELEVSVWGETPAPGAVRLIGDDHGVHGGQRSGRLWREVETATGVRRDLLADDRRQVTTPVEQRRNCMTCGLTGCASRVEAHLPAEAL